MVVKSGSVSVSLEGGSKEEVLDLWINFMVIAGWL
jgi:hypothetical protein